MADSPDFFADHVARWRASSPGRPAGAPVPGPGQESVWDYPRPPRVEAVHEPLRVEHRGVRLASTTRGLRVCETASPPTYYFPPQDVQRSLLERSLRTSYCEWKGRATYWALRLPDRFLPDVAWSYEAPHAYRELEGYFAFYASAVDLCMVGDERVQPQAGGFYGGWVTSRIVGPFKGEPGTGHW